LLSFSLTNFNQEESKKEIEKNPGANDLITLIPNLKTSVLYLIYGFEPIIQLLYHLQSVFLGKENFTLHSSLW